MGDRDEGELPDWRYDPDYADTLFVYAHDDLRIRHEAIQQNGNHVEYERLNAGRILRQLLTDECPLCTLVNERHKIDLVFPVLALGTPKRADAPLQYAPYLPAPTGLPGQHLHILTLPEFVSGEIANFGDQPVQRKDVINVVSNVLGGVHFNKKLTMQWRRQIVKFNHMVQVGDTGSVLKLLDGIVNRTLYALYPLREAVEAFHENKP